MAAKKRPQDSKSVFFPKMRMEPWRLLNYRSAHKILCQQTGRAVPFAEWVRECLDDEAEAIFEQYGEPGPELLKMNR